MTTDEFNRILEGRIYLIRKSLASKATEYATDDRLHNFKEAAETFGGLPTQVCWSYMMKHLISVKDMADGKKEFQSSVVAEKIGDAINYLILMEALLLEDDDHTSP